MDKKIEQKYIELQTAVQEIEHLQRQLDELQTQRMELENIKNSLNEIEKIKGKNEILIPIGGGVFTKGSVNNSEEVIMNVGSGVYIHKKTADASKIVEKQIDDFKNLIQQTEEALVERSVYAEDLQNQLNHLSSGKE